MDWRFVVTGRQSPAMNMAVDEAILESVKKGMVPPTIRFYDWSVPTVSIGYHQIAEREVDLERLNAQGWGFVRRPTGGRAVLHWDEVTYAVLSPLAGRLNGSITDTYSTISLALAEGLRLMGIPAELEKGSLSAEEQRLPANPCFNSLSRYEIASGGRKLIGSAQRRMGGYLLQHGAILRNHDQVGLASVMRGLSDAKREQMASILQRTTVSIAGVLGRDVTFDECVEAFLTGFRQAWEGDTFMGIEALTDMEMDLAAELEHERYNTKEWNYSTPSD